MEGKVVPLRKPLVSAKGDVREFKVKEPKKPLVPPKGAKNEKRFKQQDLFEWSFYLMIKVMFFVVLPLLDWEVYLTYGPSRRFARSALFTFLLIVTHIRLSKMISHKVLKVLMTPAIMGSFAIFERNFELISLAGFLVIAFIIYFVSVLRDENGA